MNCKLIPYWTFSSTFNTLFCLYLPGYTLCKLLKSPINFRKKAWEVSSIICTFTLDGSYKWQHPPLNYDMYNMVCWWLSLWCFHTSKGSDWSPFIVRTIHWFSRVTEQKVQMIDDAARHSRFTLWRCLIGNLINHTPTVSQTDKFGIGNLCPYRSFSTQLYFSKQEIYDRTVL